MADDASAVNAAAHAYVANQLGNVPVVADRAGRIAGKVADRAIATHTRRLKLIGWAVGVGIMALLGFIIGLGGEDETVVADTIDAEDPDASPTIQGLGESGQAFIATYQQAAASHDVPWTIISAIALNATEHGRRSPYDAVDRDPTRPASTFQSNTFLTNGQAPVPVDGLTCPLARSYFIDSWGFGRPGGRGHEGVDMFAARGTPIFSVTDGTVAAKGVNGLGGQRLGIVDGEGRYWYYAHLDSYAPGIEQGSTVTSGQVIGTVGNTGDYAKFTPTHLHLGLYPGGRGSSAINAYQTMATICAGLQFESQDASGTTVAYGPGTGDGHDHPGPAALGGDITSMFITDAPASPTPAATTDPTSPTPDRTATPPAATPAAEPEGRTAVFPVVVPSIGMPALGQGLGPFLLTPDAVEEFGISNPNDVDLAAQGVARILSAHADDVAEDQQGSRTWRPDPDDTETVDAFWTDVLDAAADWFVADSADVNTCARPSQPTDAGQVAAAIESLWRCEAERADGAAGTLHVPVGWDPQDRHLQVLTGHSATSRLILDALRVADAHSGMQPPAAPGTTDDDDGAATTDDTPDTPDTIGTACDPDADGPVGIFPLPAGTTDDVGNDVDRCDPLANIAAAASLVVNGFITTEEDFPTDDVDAAAAAAALSAGWQALPWTLGSTATQAGLAATGPAAPPTPTASCVDATRQAILAVVDDVTAAAGTPNDDVDVDSPPADPDADSIADPVVAIVNADVLPVATSHPACSSLAGNATGGWHPAWPTIAAGIASQFAVDVAHVGDQAADHDHDGDGIPDHAPSDHPTGNPDEVATDDVDVLAEQVAAIEQVAQAAATLIQDAPAANPPTDAALAQLSPTTLTYPSPAHTPTPASAPASFGQATLSAALAHGYGLHRDDPRWGDFSAIAQGGTGRGIVLVVDPANREGGPLPADSPELGPITCGSPGRQARADVAELFNTMCLDAQAQGVTLTLGPRSAFRTPADQAALQASRGAYAAQGVSNHQRGTALDIAVAGDPNRHWLHDIVGCYDQAANAYRDLPAPVDYLRYADAAEQGTPDCGTDELPIKRIQTYGLIFPLCTQRGEAAPLANPITIRCTTSLSPFREPWHAEPGVVVQTIGGSGLGSLGGYVSAGEWARALPAAGQQWSGLIETAAAQEDIDVRILAGVAWAESAFRPEVITCSVNSSVGARGMFQFMPATAAGFGIDPCVPEQAAPASARYLNQNYDKYGSWDLALAAYNWGPGNVDRWIRSGRSRDAWPAETRNYVTKITGYVADMGGRLS